MKPTKYNSSQEIDELDEMYRRLSAAHDRIANLEMQLSRRKVPGPWREPTLKNSYAQPAPPLEQFAYRIYAGGMPEFIGHLDCSAASSGTVACTLDVDADNMTLGGDVVFSTIIFTSSTFRTAMVTVDSTTGDVTLFWPVT